MPITIDIKKDLRFQQGVEIGVEQGALKNARENALKMLQMDMSISVIQHVTGLSIALIEELQNQIRVN